MQRRVVTQETKHEITRRISSATTALACPRDRPNKVEKTDRQTKRPLSAKQELVVRKCLPQIFERQHLKAKNGCGPPPAELGVAPNIFQ